MKTALNTPPDLFKAFADSTRLRILNLLLEGELCVCDLCEVLDIIQPTVSRHLGHLRRAGLVTDRRDGKWMHYSIAEQPDRLRRTLLDCVRSCLRQVNVLREDLSRLRSDRPSGSCSKGRTGRGKRGPLRKR